MPAEKEIFTVIEFTESLYKRICRLLNIDESKFEN
jgi:hypothetical protein